MATVAGVAAVVSAVAGVGSAIIQQRQGRRVAREQRRQNELRARQARAQRTREVRQRFAQARIQAAELEQAGFAFGVPGASQVQGQVGAVRSDVASAAGASQRQLGIASLIGQSQNRVSEIQSEFNPFGAIQSIAGAATNPQTNRAVADLFS